MWERNMVPGEKHSNQIAEVATILAALQQTDPYIPITFVTDSRYAIDGLTKHLPAWENKGWINVENSDYLKATTYQLRRRSAQTSFVWVKGHNGNHGNEQADQLANKGANKQDADIIDLSIPNEFNLQGASLLETMQSIAYQGIRTKSKMTPRCATTCNLDLTRYAIEDLTGHLENDAAIWKGCRNKDFTRKIRQFLYKAIHNAYRIGEFWTNIPTYEQRAQCSHCQTDIETLEHIMLECTSNARTKIWTLAENIWPEKYGDWPQIRIGTILGCGSISTTPLNRSNNENQDQLEQHHLDHKQGEERLLRILISESSHLIWVLRCDRTINGTQHSEESITKCWYTTLNKRLQIDRITAKRIKRTEKFKNLVTKTWSNIITTNTPYNKNWAIALEVLVGIIPSRPSTNEAPR
ncbi:RnaseH-domain-containing protein [Suillus occidentalis]|nr:RnaseH-domain-containing protein [Suillus occidentalis]